MSGCEINANEMSVEDALVSENTKIYIFVNLAFTVLLKPFSQSSFNTTEHFSIPSEYCVNQYVKCIPVLSEPYKLGDKTNAKIVTLDLEYDCSNLYFDEEGKCIDYPGMMELILEAISDVKIKLTPYLSCKDAQVIISIVGMDNLPELIFGTGFLLDNKLDLSLVEDDIIEYFILSEYTPPLLDFINKGWSITVVDIKMLQLNLLLSISVTNETDRTKMHDIIDSSSVTKTHSSPTSEVNRPKSNENLQNETDQNRTDNLKPVEETLSTDIVNKDNIRDDNTPLFHLSATYEENKPDYPVPPDIDIIDKIKGQSKFLRKIIMPWAAFSLISDALGGEKIEDDAWEILKAYLRGNKEEANRQWQKLGNDTLEYIHNTLDLVSFVPGVGALPSLLNAFIYGIEYDYAFFNGDMEKARDRQASCLIASAGAIPFFRIGRAIPQVGKMLKTTKYIDAIDAQKVLNANVKGAKDALSMISMRGYKGNLPYPMPQRQMLKADMRKKILEAGKNRQKIQELKNSPDIKEYLNIKGNTFSKIRQTAENYYVIENVTSFVQNFSFVSAGRSKVMKKSVENAILWLSESIANIGKQPTPPVPSPKTSSQSLSLWSYESVNQDNTNNDKL